MRVLAIGAHPDDIELGCGGALLEHRDAGHDLTMLVMTEGSRGPQGMVTRIEEQVDVARVLGARLVWGGFVDGAVPPGHESVAVIEAAIGDGVDVVYTHTTEDTHQDHRATAQATFAATRRTPRVLCFETPSSVGFTPTLFVDIDGRVEAKLDLLRIHLSQVLAGGPVDLEAVEAQARFRGSQARARNAEAFSVHRLLWEPTTIASHPRREAAAAAEELSTGPTGPAASTTAPPVLPEETR
ncbi:MAG: PIG-L family deacetylase [Actinomycetota bacterium]|jgi:LmbE family N-acetylglucosaminyl deacetylase|nr:PIG-L family deacetylase [Actinomycetota bacterium]